MADPQQPGEGAQGPVFSIDKIYLKDLSLENPGSPQSFLAQEQPQVEVGLRTRGEQVQPDVYECVLTVTLTAKAGDKTLFLVEAAQAGLFTIRRRSFSLTSAKPWPTP
jgi:preprotein translocase subunit SecB